MATARSLFIRADHDEQLPNKVCRWLLVLVLVLVRLELLLLLLVEVVSERESSTYVNRCVTEKLLVSVVDASSLAARVLNDSCKLASHSIAMEAVGATEGTTVGVTVGFGTGDIVGFPGVGVGAAVGDAVGLVVGFAVGLRVGEGVGIAVGAVLG